jgi:ornithine--oxo-acid transaminase
MYDIMQPNLDISEMFADRQFQRNALHTRYLNEQLVRVLKTIGYDVGFQRGQGQYLYDRDNDRYLDLLSGFGVFALGRNHPAIKDALKSVLDSDLPNLVQLDLSTLAGILAERLIALCPISTRSFCEFRDGMCRSCDQVRARRDWPDRHCLLRSCYGCPMAHCH